METLHFDALVIGSGAAGLNAADELYTEGVTNVAVITEGLYASTSFNTGSDKQTYYKLSTTGHVPDSVYDMAKTYHACGGMEGFHALKEAALSLRCFYKLVQYGVPFPMNEYGEYVGYRTDHDDHVRASSCGPLTSKYMCEALIRQVKAKNIPVYEPMRVVKLLVSDGSIRGAIAIDFSDASFHVFEAPHIILATGGAAGIYASSVYPKCHTGGIGIALEIGAAARNLGEWQYGLASTDFRWNLSGSYQQAIPRYLSTDADGNTREFLSDYIDGDIPSLIFRKGYNWPFAPKNLTGENRSSLIDIAVYTETAVKGNRVFLDFTQDPAGFDIDRLDDEAKEFFHRSGMDAFDTPIKRLRHLNERAYRLYADNGIDLETDRLAADVCAQHCNGGLTVDEHYMTTVDGLYACGECAGVFGMTRPGGSALNDTQVSSLTAAADIAEHRKKPSADFDALAKTALEELQNEKAAYENGVGQPPSVIRAAFEKDMSRNGAMIRRKTAIEQAEADAKRLYETLTDVTYADTPYAVCGAFVNRDLVLTKRAVLAAERGYFLSNELSRGGFFVSRGGGTLSEEAAHVTLSEDKDTVTEVMFDGADFRCRTKTVSPIPESEQWFETVLNRERK